MDVLLEPWHKPVAEDATTAAVKGVTTTNAISVNADRIQAYRVGIQEGRRMSQLERMVALTARQGDLSKKTDKVLDGIEDKCNKYETKLNAAEEKHHGYYDKLIGSMDDSIVVIDRLSNGPLSGDGEK